MFEHKLYIFMNYEQNKYGNVYCVDIIYLIQFKIRNYRYSLFDLTSNLIYEKKTTTSKIKKKKTQKKRVLSNWSCMRRIHNNRSENAK